MDPPPNNDALRALLDEHQAANHATIVAMTDCDKSYKSEFKRFTAWVDSEPDLGPDDGGSYLTRDNVDHYFTRVIANRSGQENGIKRVVSALDWYATHRDHVGATPAFKVGSGLVTQALVTQKAFNLVSGGTANPGTDPHKGLKDILPETSRIRFMKHIFRERADWGPSSCTFTWGNTGAVRGASCNKMGYCDLNLSFGFGPIEDEPATGLVQRRGKVNKDRHETDKQVFVWRHKNYLLCSVFSTAAYVINQITQNPTINFLHPNKRERASWWDTPLIDWNCYNGECATYCELC
jgi:hypothetical protein